MRLFKNYKRLYKFELNNRKMYEERYNQIKKENIEIQKQSELPKMRTEIRGLKEKVTALALELEDTKGFLLQEKEAKEALLAERDKLKKEITSLKRKLTIAKKESK